MRYIYTFLLYLSMPFIVMRLLWRSLTYSAYRKRMRERFGFYPNAFNNCIWIHAVSVGETIAATPLIKALQKAYPDKQFVVTTMTPTGAERVQKTFGNSVHHAYLPYDFPGAVNRFLKNIEPAIGIIIETELWPNLLAASLQKQIPVCLLNARLSERSFRGYTRIASLSADMMKTFAMIVPVGEQDATNFISLGASPDRVHITGNVKFDIVLPPIKNELRQKIGGRDRFVWIAASTHAGEEQIAIAAHQEILKINPQALLILVPRHPDRFDSVAKLCESAFKTVRHSQAQSQLQSQSQSRSQSQSIPQDTVIYLGDTMGELITFYAASDVAFVGGSLIEQGGHNMIEPAALAKPILMGPHLFNFAYESELFYAANALIKINDMQSLANNVILLMQNEQQRFAMGNRAREIVESNRGALDKQLQLIGKCLLLSPPRGYSSLPS